MLGDGRLPDRPESRKFVEYARGKEPLQSAEYLDRAPLIASHRLCNFIYGGIARWGCVWYYRLLGGSICIVPSRTKLLMHFSFYSKLEIKGIRLWYITSYLLLRNLMVLNTILKILKWENFVFSLYSFFKAFFRFLL